MGALRKMGVDEVYDTTMGADLTVMEESKEFVKKYKAGAKLPLFTSCCPAWVKYAEHAHPELVEQISTANRRCRFSRRSSRSISKQVQEVDGRGTVVFLIMRARRTRRAGTPGVRLRGRLTRYGRLLLRKEFREHPETGRGSYSRISILRLRICRLESPPVRA